MNTPHTDPQRVFVTGMGAITPFGLGVPSLWEGMSTGQNAIRPITRYNTENFSCRIGGCLPDDLDWLDLVPPKMRRKIDPFQAFAIIAAGEALSSSLINLDDVDTTRFGVSAGSSNGGVGTGLTNHRLYLEKGLRSVSPFTGVRYTVNGAAAWPAIAYGLKGPNEAFSMTCASGNAAIGNAFRKIKYGYAERMLAGATDYLDEFILVFFHRARAIARTHDLDDLKAILPFHKERRGTILSEGAGFLLLESESAARERGAPILGEILGMGETSDAHNIVAPAPGGAAMARAISGAMEEAQLQPQDIDYVSAHATGTLFNDPTEVDALKSVLGSRAYEIPVTGPKSQLGHLIGASSAVEAIVGIKGGLEGVVTPTLHLEEPDPRCDLDHQPHTPKVHPYSVFLNNAFGFGGHNVVLAIRAGLPR